MLHSLTYAGTDMLTFFFVFFFFFNDTATTEIYTLSLHDALPISHHGLARCHDIGKSAIAIEAGFARFVDDCARQPLAPARIEPFGDGIFVEQPLDRVQSWRQFAGADRRRHMSDGDGAEPALRRGGFAGTVDAERIDHRPRPEQRVRPARPRQRDRLPR